MSSVEPAPAPVMPVLPPNQALYHDPTRPPQPPPYSQFVVTTQPVIVERTRFFTIPVRTVCRHCQADIVTSIDYRVGLMTFVACGLLIALGLIIGCCLVPFCFSGAKDAHHSCPNCKKVLGVYKRM